MITDFRLRVFRTAAEKLSFTRAASELFITQPAVTKHVGESWKGSSAWRCSCAGEERFL